MQEIEIIIGIVGGIIWEIIIIEIEEHSKEKDTNLEENEFYILRNKLSQMSKISIYLSGW